jgi:alpha-L-fucosidase
MPSPWTSLFLLALPALASPTPGDPPDERMDWWRAARFGLFLHWGLYSIPAGEWNGETNHAEWIRTTARIPLEEYERFAGAFDPVGFDADAWARMAAEAGMGYVVITTKHHDGFCLFDSALTDFDVMSTPFERDVMKELADACRRRGLQIGWYHSIMDWHHPDYLPRRDWEAERGSEGADFARYERYLSGQVRELLTNYGPIGVMWFDGEWEATWNHEQGSRLYELCRGLQPDVIVNNRVDKGRSGMAGMTSSAEFRGDFGTPEQEIPARGLPGVDWETCMTMNGNWGFNAHDRDFKSTEELVRKLIDVASKGGNFLLNVGPTARGEFPPESVARLAEIGAWMRVHGDAIHGTEASPFEELTFGRATLRKRGDDATIFLHVFEWPADGRLRVPGLGNELSGARLLSNAGGELACGREGTDVVIAVPRAMPDAIATVVALDVRGVPIVYETPRILADADFLVRELSVEIAARSPGLELRYTLDGSEPVATSPLASGPIRIRETTRVRARAFHDGRPVSAVAEHRFARVAPAPSVGGERGAPGLALQRYRGEFERLPDFGELAPEPAGAANGPGTIRTVGLPESARGEERFALRLTGFLEVPADDVYCFELSSDDGSQLWLDGACVIDNDGLHSNLARGGAVALAAGLHALEVRYFNRTGGAELSLAWKRPGETLAPVPAGSLWTAAD